MRTAILALLTATLLLALHTPTAAQDGKLTKDETAWINKLAGAGWTGQSSADGISVSARNGSVMSDHILSVLKKDDALNDCQRGALLECVRFKLTRPGWLERFRVTPGTYTAGFRQGKHNLQVVVRDKDGAEVDVSGWYMTSGTDYSPKCSATASGGNVLLNVAWGNISFSWDFVSEDAHEAAVGACTERRAGKVRILSDIGEPSHIQRIAELCDKAVAANPKLMGGELPEDFVYTCYLFGDYSRYTAIDELLTGGNFKRNGAFTAWRNSQVYLFYYPHHDGDYGLPSSLLEVIIHEFHHQYVNTVFPTLRYSAEWFQEACAEVAAQQGLELADKQAAEMFRNRRYADVNFYHAAGRLPTAEDLLKGEMGVSVSAHYSGMWMLGHELAKQPDDLKAMVKLAAEHQQATGMDDALLSEFDKRYPSMRTLLQRGIEHCAKQPTGWVPKDGTIDERDGVLEFNSEIATGGYALWGEAVKGTSFTFSGEFQFDNKPAPQVDLIFNYSAGVGTYRFMKIAILRDKVDLFTCKDGEWNRVQFVSYETKLDVVNEGDRVWHTFKLTWNAETGKARLDLTNGRWAELAISNYESTKDTHIGLGAYNGVTWFRGVELK